MCRFVSIFLISFYALPVIHAQVDAPASNPTDTGSKLKPKVQLWEDYQLAPAVFETMDTAFDFVHRYAPLTPLEHGWQDLGQAGSPAKSLLPSAIYSPGLRSGFEAYRMLIRPSLEQVFSARNPYTRFHYTQGGRGLIGLQALHTQNITPGWNMTIDYHSLQGQGLFEHSAFKQRNIRTGSHYQSSNGRFINRTTATWNRFQRNEHWGLFDSARLFSEQPSIFTPRNSTANSSYFHTNHEMHNSYSLASSGLLSGLSVVNLMRYTRERFEYTDLQTPDTFYSGINYYQMRGCDDSFYLREAATEGGLMYSGLRVKKQNAAAWNGAFLGGISKISAGAYRAVPGSYHNTWIRTTLGFGLPNGKQYLRLNAIRYLSGYNAGDYLLQLNSRIRKLQRFVGFQWQLQKSRAAFTEQFYFSKHYSWNNTFNPVLSNEFQLHAGISLKRHQLEVLYRSGSVKGFVFLNSEFAPVQNMGSISYGDLGLNSTSDWQHFFLRSSLHFMGSTNNAAMPVPRFCGTQSMGYKGVWFDGVLRIRAGLDLWWYSRFYGFGYNPALARFYVQQQVQTGAYPRLDVFVNGEVKNVQFFVKMEHINQGWYPSPKQVPYWSSARYALDPRRFILGLRWGFFN
jgi:hypothetical protein